MRGWQSCPRDKAEPSVSSRSQGTPACGCGRRARAEIGDRHLPAVLGAQRLVRARDERGSSTILAVVSRHSPLTLPRASHGAIRARDELRRRLTLPESGAVYT